MSSHAGPNPTDMSRSRFNRHNLSGANFPQEASTSTVPWTLITALLLGLIPLSLQGAEEIPNRDPLSAKRHSRPAQIVTPQVERRFTPVEAVPQVVSQEPRSALPPLPDSTGEWEPDAAVGLPDAQELWNQSPGLTPYQTAPDDELLTLGLQRAAEQSPLSDEAPLNWQELDPSLSVEVVPLFTFRDDLHDWWPNVRSDVRSLLTWQNALVLGVAGGVTLGLRESADGAVRDWTLESPERWGEGTEVLRQFGEYQWQVPAILLGYTWSLWRQDAELHAFLCSTISSYTLNSIATVGLKAVTDTSRPSTAFEDGRYGFPSFHASSTFAIAANIETWYGWKAGLPAYALAGLVGWSRIDQREHDLSDVVFGSVLGYTIGKSVALSRRTAAESTWQLSPWFEANHQATGVSFDLRY
jgi:membrane-associated phospholipid phosphatase